MRPVLIALALVAGLAQATSAQVLRDCDRWQANARNLMSPPEVALRSFADGAIRLMALDTVEPALSWAHLLVTYPVPDEPCPACVLISEEGGRGFAGIGMEALRAGYDPATGLVLTVPVGRADGITTTWRDLRITVNQALGTVQVE